MTMAGRNQDIDEDDFEDAGAYSEERVINVSPLPARLSIASVPGSSPRKIRIPPGGSVSIPSGYTRPFEGDSLRSCAPWIETHTEREAWPGKRDRDEASGKFSWLIKPGPRLPQCVTEDKADEYRAKWNQAMRDKQTAATAPLRMQLHATDGRLVDVDMEIAPKSGGAPAAPRKRTEIVDEVDMTTGPVDDPPDDLDAPPSDDPDAGGRRNEPIAAPAVQPEPVTLPTAPAPVHSKGSRK